MTSFADLVASRKAWIDQILRPWCGQAVLKDLRLAAELWADIAGRVAPEKTLWFWAWSRFPDLVHAELASIDETNSVAVVLRDGREFTGIPDARQSRQGMLVLIGRGRNSAPAFAELGPFSLDEISSVKRVSDYA